MISRKTPIAIVSTGVIVALVGLATACGMPIEEGPSASQPPEDSASVQQSETALDPGLISLVSEYPPDLFEELIGPSRERAEPLLRALEEATWDDETGMTPDHTEIWGYGREGFDGQADALRSRLLEMFPDEFGGSWSEAVDPVVWVLQVGPSEAMLAYLAAVTDFEVKMHYGATTYADRRQVANQLNKQLNDPEIWAGANQFGDYAEMVISDEQYNRAPDTIVDAVSDAVGLTPAESAVLAGYLEELYSDEQQYLGVQIGPLIVYKGPDQVDGYW